MVCIVYFSPICDSICYAMIKVIWSDNDENISVIFDAKKKSLNLSIETPSCDPAGARTQDPNIKSVVLYQLSY